MKVFAQDLSFWQARWRVQLFQSYINTETVTVHTLVINDKSVCSMYVDLLQHDLDTVYVLYQDKYLHRKG